jgi:hypothetical protein
VSIISRIGAPFPARWDFERALSSVERFHRTLRQEFLTGRVVEDLPSAQSELERWVGSYKTARPHSALNMATPASRFIPTHGGRPADASALVGERAGDGWISRKITTNGVISGVVKVPPGGDALPTASCAIGDVVTGGGYARGNSGLLEVQASEPTSGGDGWAVAFASKETGTTIHEGIAFAVCADMTP